MRQYQQIAFLKKAKEDKLACAYIEFVPISKRVSTSEEMLFDRICGLVRYPEVREGGQPTAIGFRPRNIRIWIAEKIFAEAQRLEPELSQALTTSDAAFSFLVSHPKLDVRGKESLLTQLFGSEDGARHSAFLEKFRGAKSYIDAISQVIDINIKANRFQS